MSQNRLMLGTKIKQICEERGISVRQLERDAGLSERTINRWDQNSPSVDKVVAVSQALNVPIEELLGLKVPKPEDEKSPATESDGTNSKRDEFIHDVLEMSGEQLTALSIIAKSILGNR